MVGRTRLVILDDQELFRRGVANLLKECDDFEVLGEFPVTAQAITLCREMKPDVILFDVMLPGTSGLDLLVRVRRDCPDSRVVIVTSSDRESDILASLQLGATGYILKTIDFASLVLDIRLARQGEIPLSPQVATALVRRLWISGGNGGSGYSGVPGDHAGGGENGARRNNPQLAKLTSREREILEFIAKGASNKAISESLVLSEHTIRAHMRNILNKLGLQNRVQAAAYTARLNGESNESGYSDETARDLAIIKLEKREAVRSARMAFD